MRRAWIAIVLAACSERAAAPPPPAPAGPPAPAAAASSRGWIGVTVSAEAVDVVPAFDGVIASMTARVGDRVEAGAVLATLDDRPLREALAVVRAQVGEADATIRRGEVEVERARYRREVAEAGLQAGTEAVSAVEEARLGERAATVAVAEARAARAQARARLDAAASRLAETAIVAPFPGTVGLRYVDVGAAVGPRAPVVRLVGAGRARLRFAIAVADAARIAAGVEVVAAIDGWPPLPAAVAAIAPEVDQASQLIYVDAELAAGATAVPPGLAAVVRCKLSRCRADDGP